MECKLFRCMVVRHTDTDNEQVGIELFTPDDIVKSVRCGDGGCYLLVYEHDGYGDLTPIIIENRDVARLWAKKVKEN